MRKSRSSRTGAKARPKNELVEIDACRHPTYTRLGADKTIWLLSCPVDEKGLRQVQALAKSRYQLERGRLALVASSDALRARQALIELADNLDLRIPLLQTRRLRPTNTVARSLSEGMNGGEDVEAIKNWFRKDPAMVAAEAKRVFEVFERYARSLNHAQLGVLMLHEPFITLAAWYSQGGTWPKWQKMEKGAGARFRFHFCNRKLVKVTVNHLSPAKAK